MKGRSNVMLTIALNTIQRGWENVRITVYRYCLSVITTDKIYKKIQRKQTKHEIRNNRNKFPSTQLVDAISLTK
jgi:hypothetical protein